MYDIVYLDYIIFIQSITYCMKIYTTLGYIVSLILLNLGHVFCFRIVSRMCITYCVKLSPFLLLNQFEL